VSNESVFHPYPSVAKKFRVFGVVRGSPHPGGHHRGSQGDNLVQFSFRPAERMPLPNNRIICRPVGTFIICAINPRLKPWAIIGRHSLATQRALVADLKTFQNQTATVP
jgi:hypothetical protein